MNIKSLFTIHWRCDLLVCHLDWGESRHHAERHSGFATFRWNIIIDFQEIQRFFHLRLDVAQHTNFTVVKQLDNMLNRIQWERKQWHCQVTTKKNQINKTNS